MIQHAHEKFRRWALWVLSPAPGFNLGYGKNVCLRILEGKGQILPGAPPGSGSPRIHLDPVALQVDKFLKTRSRDEKTLVRTFYLDQFRTVEEKARKLSMPIRTMYDRLEQVQRKLLDHLDSEEQPRL